MTPILGIFNPIGSLFYTSTHFTKNEAAVRNCIHGSLYEMCKKDLTVPIMPPNTFGLFSSKPDIWGLVGVLQNLCVSNQKAVLSSKLIEMFEWDFEWFENGSDSWPKDVKEILDIKDFYFF